MRVAEDEERRLLMTESVCFRFVVEEERLSTGDGKYAHRQRQTGSGVRVTGVCTCQAIVNYYNTSWFVYILRTV